MGFILEDTFSGEGELLLSGECVATASYIVRVYAAEQIINGTPIRTGFKRIEPTVSGIEPNSAVGYNALGKKLILRLDDGQWIRLLVHRVGLTPKGFTVDFMATGPLEPPTAELDVSS